MKIHDEITVLLEKKEIEFYIDGSEIIRVTFFNEYTAQSQYNYIISDLDKCSEEFKNSLEENNILYRESERVNFEDSRKFMSRMQLLTEFKFLQTKGESTLTKMIFDEDNHHTLIAMFALQYYHVTNMCRTSISAAMTTLHGRQKQQAIHFFKEELGHEQLLKRALSSIGIDDLSEKTILPSTLALMNKLKYCAMTDPLSFMAIIFLYEGSSIDGEAYVASLKRHGFSKGFIQPQQKHEDINNSGHHDKVSLSFYDSMLFINAADRERIESVIKETIEIEYYMHDELVKEYEKKRELHYT